MKTNSSSLNYYNFNIVCTTNVARGIVTNVSESTRYRETNRKTAKDALVNCCPSSPRRFRVTHVMHKTDLVER